MKLNRVISLEWYLENNASDFDPSVNRYAKTNLKTQRGNNAVY